MFCRETVLLFAALLFVVPVRADDSPITPAQEEFFESKIRPLLVDYCYECHSSDLDEPSGGLVLDTRDGIRKGGELGPAVVPKDPEESLLLSAVRYEDLEMPPDGQLSEEQIELLDKWIRMGAPDPRDSDDDETSSLVAGNKSPGADHRAIRAVRAVQGPLSNDPHRHPDAARIQQGMKSERRVRSDAADPTTLPRRLLFDLTERRTPPAGIRAMPAQPSPE